MNPDKLLSFTPNGIYCAAGDFYIDPWRPVPRAIITHAHSDHARRGMGAYLAHHDSAPVLRLRLGRDISLQNIGYRQPVNVNGVSVTLIPAGHVPGSAQVRVALGDSIWVASGDYKTEDDGLSAAFEPVPCDTFISETTFGLPVYRWQPQAAVMEDINRWWASQAEQKRPCLLIAYSLGKAQRILKHLDLSIGPVYCHGATQIVNDALRLHGIELPATQYLGHGTGKKELERALVLAPSSAAGSPWANRLGDYSLGVASGWMNLRGIRRRQAADRGFVLSDHADWDGLNAAVAATGAERVILTHGYTDSFARWLREKGIEASAEETLFEGEAGSAAEEFEAPEALPGA